MYAKMSKQDIIKCYEKESKRIIEINIENQTELLCCEDGTIFRKMKSGNWKQIANKENHKKGYNVILINKKQYMRAKIILHAMGKLSLNDKYVNIYHVNKDKLDCSFSNLKLK